MSFLKMLNKKVEEETCRKLLRKLYEDKVVKKEVLSSIEPQFIEGLVNDERKMIDIHRALEDRRFYEKYVREPVILGIKEMAEKIEL